MAPMTVPRPIIASRRGLECGEVSPLWILLWMAARRRIQKSIQSGDTSPHSKLKKKRGAVVHHASSLWERPHKTAGLGGDVLFVRPRGLVVLARGAFDAVRLTQPAPEVDGLAARAAERELRPFRRPRAVHRAVTYRATHLYHRKLTSRTWNFSPHSCYLFSRLRHSPDRNRLTYRTCRSCRPCRPPAWPPPGPPWP